MRSVHIFDTSPSRDLDGETGQSFDSSVSRHAGREFDGDRRLDCLRDAGTSFTLSDLG